MSIDAALGLARWAANTTPAKLKARSYPLTPDGDYQAWIHGLSGQMAADRAESERTVRRPTDWRPRPERRDSEAA